ncbi:hypothetical protein D3C85_881480 [compost metagenome]
MIKYKPEDVIVTVNGRVLEPCKDEIPEVKPIPEQIAMQTYSQYSKYVQERLDKKFSENEHAALCQMYIEGVPVGTAIKKMEKK